MKGLKRNETGFYYALYTGNSDRKDIDGKRTGEKEKTYGRPVFMKANISPATGYAGIEIFGKDTKYSKVICTTDTSCPITEESILWIYEGLTEYTNVNILPYNYTVSKIAKSLNNVLYAVQERRTDQRGI